MHMLTQHHKKALVQRNFAHRSYIGPSSQMNALVQRWPCVSSYIWANVGSLRWPNVKLLDGWLVGCSLTSHSVVFQLYSDGTVVQFPNLDLLPGTQRHGQLGVFTVPSLPDTGTGMSEDVVNLLAIRELTCSSVHTLAQRYKTNANHQPTDQS